MGPSPDSQERVEALVASLTAAEKIAQLSCAARLPDAPWLVDAAGSLDEAELLRRYPHGIGQLGRPSQRLRPAAAAALTNQVQQTLQTRTRPGIGALCNEEGVHGHMALGGTSYPAAIALASTWDLALVEEIYAAIAREVRARGSNYVYAPVLDLARDPRWGRVEETFGEDVHLVSEMGLAAIRGLQGTAWRIPADRVLACAKHFAGHGAPIGGVNGAPLGTGDRGLREEHLVPFEAAVRRGNVGAIMAAYHDIDGIPCHANRWLLSEVLRDEWGFRGMVSSDGFGVPQLETVHRITGGAAGAARLAIEAGIDCEVPQGHCFATLPEQLAGGLVSQHAIDRAVTHVLLAKDRLGLLDEVAPVDEAAAAITVNTPDHRDLALQAARRSAVLLSNDGTLPLSPAAYSNIAVIGPNAAELHLGGYAEDPGRGVTVLDGIRHRAGDAVTYALGCRITAGRPGPSQWWQDEIELAEPGAQDALIAAAAATARTAGLVILVIGGNEGTAREGWWYDHLGDRDSLDLPGRQLDLLRAVSATGRPVVAVVMGGRPLDLEPVVEHCAAVLQVWYPGQEGGTAVAEILFGDVAPAGRLPISFPRSVGQLPVYYGQKWSARRGYLFGSQEPLFPFGHGLTYTTFEYGEVVIDPPVIDRNQETTVSVTVTNVGTRPGTEVVQCYVSDRIASITRAQRVLRGFSRISADPGQSTRVSFMLGPHDLALYSRSREWVVEPGEFDIYVGGSAAARTRGLLTVR